MRPDHLTTLSLTGSSALTRLPAFFTDCGAQLFRAAMRVRNAGIVGFRATQKLKQTALRSVEGAVKCSTCTPHITATFDDPRSRIRHPCPAASLSSRQARRASVELVVAMCRLSKSYHSHLDTTRGRALFVAHCLAHARSISSANRQSRVPATGSAAAASQRRQSIKPAHSTARRE